MKKTVETEDLANLAMLARDLKISRASLSNLVARHDDFPEPVLNIGYSGMQADRLHSRQQVFDWARARTRLTIPTS